MSATAQVVFRSPLLLRERSTYPLLRLGFLTLLLIVEAIAVSMSFDAAARGNDPGWAGTVLNWSPVFLRWALVAGAAASALMLWYFPDAIRTAGRVPHRTTAIALWTLAHLGAFGAFVLITSRVLASENLSHPLTAPWLILWLGIGLLTALFWALAALPVRTWVQLFWKCRRVLLTSCIIGVVGSVAASASREGWDVLSGPTLWASNALLRTFTSDVVFEPASRLLGAGDFHVEVGTPCSGYEGIGLIAAYLGGYLVLFRRDLRFPHALFLLPLGITAIWSVNVIRIVALILIGDRISPNLALNGFHSQAGWLGFNLVAITMVFFVHRSHLFLKDPTRHESAPSATAAYLAPLLSIVALQMTSAAFVSNPIVLYPVRALVAGALLLFFWRYYTSLRIPNASGGGGILWAVGVGVAVFLVWMAIVPLATPTEASADPARGLGGLPRWAMALWFMTKIVGFVVITPLAEELAFRGYLLRRLIHSDFEEVPIGRFSVASFVISSVLFGLLHGQWLAGTLAGMAYALAVYRTGNLRHAVVAHAVTNALLLAVMAYTGNWQE